MDDLSVLVEVIRQGSFTKAGRVLDMPKSTVSRRVARLEDELGVELLQRRHRSFEPTPHGRSLYQRCLPALQELADARRAVSDDERRPAGVLKITAPRELSALDSFAQLISDYRLQCPDVQVELDLTARVVDLIEEGVDVAFRFHIGPLPDNSRLLVKRCDLLGPSPAAGVFAAPAYLACRPKVRSPRDLRRHDCLCHAHPQFNAHWSLSKRGGKLRRFEIRPVVLCADHLFLLQLALKGTGLVLAGVPQVRPYVEAGRLIRVLPRWSLSEPVLSLLWPRTRHLAPRVRAFIDHVSLSTKLPSQPRRR